MFERPGHERRPEPNALRGAQIAQVGGHHHHVGGLQVEKVRGGLVHLAVGLVVADQLGSPLVEQEGGATDALGDRAHDLREPDLGENQPLQARMDLDAALEHVVLLVDQLPERALGDGDERRLERDLEQGEVLRLRLGLQRRGHSVVVEARAEGATCPTHQYLFTWASPAFGGVAGSCHALEIPFVFGVLANQGAELILGGAAGDELWGLSDTMQDAWVAFARTGDPNHAGLPEWPAWEAGARPVMRLDVEPALVHDPGGVERELWDGLL